MLHPHQESIRIRIVSTTTRKVSNHIHIKPPENQVERRTKENDNYFEKMNNRWEKTERKGKTYAKHCKTAFMKQVLPKLVNPTCPLSKETVEAESVFPLANSPSSTEREDACEPSSPFLRRFFDCLGSFALFLPLSFRRVDLESLTFPETDVSSSPRLDTICLLTDCRNCANSCFALSLPTNSSHA